MVERGLPENGRLRVGDEKLVGGMEMVATEKTAMGGKR